MPKVKLFNTDQALQNVMELFWTKGYHGSSIRDLVKATGLSRSSLYDTFSDKHQLYLSALKYYQDQQRKGLMAALDKQANSKKKIEAIFYYFLQQIITQPKGQGCFMVNTVTEMSNQDKKIARLSQEDFEEMEQLFLSIVKEGQKKNEITKAQKPQALAQYLFSAYLGFRISGQTNPDKNYLNNIIAVILNAL